MLIAFTPDAAKVFNPRLYTNSASLRAASPISFASRGSKGNRGCLRAGFTPCMVCIQTLSLNDEFLSSHNPSGKHCMESKGRNWMWIIHVPVSKHAKSVVYLVINILLRRRHGWPTEKRGKRYVKSDAEQTKQVEIGLNT